MTQILNVKRKKGKKYVVRFCVGGVGGHQVLSVVSTSASSASVILPTAASRMTTDEGAGDEAVESTRWSEVAEDDCRDCRNS